MRRIIVASILLCALGAVVYFALTRERDQAIVPAQVGETVTPNDTKTISETTDRYTIDVKYRHVGIPMIDAKIDASVQKVVDAFKKDATSAAPEADMRPYSLNGEFADVYIGGDVVSERINFYQDMGGAHGLPFVLTLNFDAKTADEITLDDALVLIGQTLPQVSQSALAQLDQEFGESVFIDGAAPKVENYQTFAINAYNVTFIFQAYQVVAYAAGMPEVAFKKK